MNCLASLPPCVIAFLASCIVCVAQDSTLNEGGQGNQGDTGRLFVSEKLTVATREVPPFAALNEVGQWEGISIDLLRAIKAELEDESGHKIEIQFKDLSLSSMLDQVESGAVDIAAAALTVNYEREKRFDFTHSYHTSGLGIAVATKQRRSGWNGLFDAVFSRTFFRIVGGLLLAMLVSAVGIYLFERRGNREQFGHGWKKGIASGMWWAAVTLTTVGYGDKVPKTLGGRLIGLIWMFAGLFIIAAFTAAVTSAVTVTQLQSGINGPSDLSRVKVATVDGSTSAEYLQSRHIIFRGHTDIQEAIESLIRGECDAVVYDAAIMRHVAYRRFSGEAFVLPARFERQNYAFALPSESALREPINQILLRHTSGPKWDGILAGYFGEEE